MKSLLLMITFLTRIPIKYNYDFERKDFIKGIKFLPIVGLIIGMFLYLISLINNYIDKPVSVLIILLSYLWITGALHIDGLADTVDGIFSNRSKDRILEIMKDSRIGAFGVISIIILFISNIIILYYLDLKYLIILPVVGRSCALIASSTSIYAREDGLGKDIVDNSGNLEGFIGFIFPIILGILLYDYKIILALILTYIITIAITKYISKIIDGMTGDTIGFTIEFTQIAFLIIAYIINKVII